jgi:prenyltransferase beta subunit
MTHPKAIVALALAALLPATLRAQPAAAEPAAHPLQGTEITADQQRAVERGLAALAGKQARDGSFGSREQRHAGITSLCAMAFMQSGNLPGRGRYGPQVEKALSFVLASAQESGLIASDNYSPPMYGHGFATLFLAEVYGMTGDERVKEKLQKAVKLIQKSQNVEGGWRYQPSPQDADLSVTICQIMALRASRDAGIKVEKEVIDRAIDYVRKCQNADGGFSYQAGQNGFGGTGGSGFGRTAAGLASLYYAGISQGKEIDSALKYMLKYRPGNARGGDVEGHYYYAQYYAVQAMFLAGGSNWTNWYPAIRKQLIDRQSKTTGLWSGDQNDEYATAMALLVLQMPNRYLPVYSGKGPGS